MKKLVLALSIIITFFPLSAESARFKGFALGVYGTGDFMLGDWADVATAGAGGGICAEVTAVRLTKIDLGASVRAEVSHIFPKSDSLISGENDIAFTGDVWLRVTFGQFAFQPEIAYGGLVHIVEGKSGSEKSGTYFDQVLRASAGLRWNPSFARNLEIELMPTFSFSPEKESKTLLTTGGLGLAAGSIVGGLVGSVFGLYEVAKASAQLDNARANLAKARLTAEELETAGTLCDGIRRQAYLLFRLLIRLDTLFMPLIVTMERAIKTHGTDYRTFSTAEKQAVSGAVTLVGSIKTVLDTPILTDEGKLAELPAEVSEISEKLE